MARELAEVKNLHRTPAQLRIAYFWAVVPELREWIAITNLKIFLLTRIPQLPDPG
jgi:hypothetical protein